MNRLLSLFLSAALLLSLSACGGPGEPTPGASSSTPPLSQPEQETDAVDTPFALACYPTFSLHPVLGENRANLTLAPLLYEPLFQVDEQFRAVPVLCSGYTAGEDGLTWTFTLRSGVTFSDGTPLTGSLAAAALNTARQAGSRYAQRLANVTAVTGDDTTLTVTLSRPNGALPLLLDIPIALGTGDTPAGTGPYVLTGEGNDLHLTAREGWWQDKPLPAHEIPLTAVTQSDALLSAFASGSVGLVDVDLMGTNALGYSGNYETWDYPSTALLYLAFNTRSGLCRDARVRQALSRAIDRTPVVQVDYARHGSPTALPVHPNSSLYDDGSAALLDYAPEEAVDTLNSLKVLGRSLTLVVNSENAAKAAAAQRIAYQLESAGMEVTLEKLPFEDYTAALAAGNFDLYLGEVVLTADFDLSPLLASNGSLNYGRWQDGQADLLLAEMAAADWDSRRDAAAALLAYLAREAPIAPIAFKTGSVLAQWGRLSGLAPLRGNVFNQLENWIIDR